VNSRINLTTEHLKNFDIIISNDLHEKLIIGYDKNTNMFYIDRTKSGKTDFDDSFPKKITAPRLTNDKKMNLTLLLDDSSVEIFADDGLTTMTALFFPNKKYTNLTLKSNDNFLINKLNLWSLKSIW
jgi:fructan beta-fructosidase